uniref:Ribonuclease P n=1 Tax=Strongyloides venezuelensis TaxID=75913 RepID=A0A0K0FE20_STRVS
MMNSTSQRRNLALRQLSSNAVTFARFFPVNHEKMQTMMEGTQTPTLISGELEEYTHKKVLQSPFDSLLNKIASCNKKNKRRVYSIEEGDKNKAVYRCESNDKLCSGFLHVSFFYHMLKSYKELMTLYK